MSNLIPLVTPANNEVGVDVETTITAIFEKQIEEGSLTPSSCFIVEIPTHDLNGLDNYLSNSAIGDIVPAKVSTQRISLVDESEYSSPDYGDSSNSGDLYRTKINIIPRAPLKPNTTYAGLLSKDIAIISVFDAKSGNNSGSGIISTLGPYTGLVEDTYTITIGLSGNENSAQYIWSRTSDGHVSTLKNARSRFLEIAEGISIRFEEGMYAIGDTFTVKVIPTDKQENIFGWTFSTGSGNYSAPEDERSDSLLDLPVMGSESTSGESFNIVSISPEYADTCVLIPRKGIAKIDTLIFSTVEYTDTYNGYMFEITPGGIAGSETISRDDTQKKITIQIEENVSTNEQIIQSFNSSSLVNSDFIGNFVGSPTIQKIQPQALMVDGNKNIPIIITFNKEIDPASIDNKIKILASQVYPAQGSKEIPFSYTVSGKVLIITLKE